MDLRRVQYFLAVAEDLHFGHAAARLGITQPALSQQVQRLEQELGATLVERTSRTSALTCTGTLVLDPLRRCLSAYEEALAITHQADHDAKVLRIGFPRGESSLVLAPFLHKISHCFPGTRIEVTEVACENQAKAIREGALAAGFMHLPALESDLAAVVVRRDRLVVILPRNHPCARDENVSLLQLEEEPFIDVQLRCPAYTHALGALARNGGFTPRIEYGASGIEATVEMVASRLGLAIVPGSAMHEHDGVVVRQLSPAGRELDLAFVLHRNKSSSKMHKLLTLIHEATLEGDRRPATKAIPRQVVMAGRA